MAALPPSKAHGFYAPCYPYAPNQEEFHSATDFWVGKSVHLSSRIIELPEGLFREAEARAALDGVTLNDLVIRYVEQGLRQGKQPSATPSRRRRSELPIARAATGHALPALTSAEIDSILEEGEAHSGRRD